MREMRYNLIGVGHNDINTENLLEYLLNEQKILLRLREFCLCFRGYGDIESLQLPGKKLAIEIFSRASEYEELHILNKWAANINTKKYKLYETVNLTDAQLLRSQFEDYKLHPDELWREDDFEMSCGKFVKKSEAKPRSLSEDLERESKPGLIQSLKSGINFSGITAGGDVKISLFG